MSTSRQEQIIALRGAGKSYAEIGAIMNIKPESAQRMFGLSEHSLGPDHRHHEAMERGSRALLERIKRERMR